MVLNEDYSKLVPQFEKLLAELDRLQLPMVAVHLDLALRRLEEIISDNKSGTPET